MSVVSPWNKPGIRLFIDFQASMSGVCLTGDDLEQALLAYCKNATSAPDPALLATDASFAKGVGGTKADHIAEKVMGEMLRDTGAPGAQAGGSLFEQWIAGTSAAAVACAKGKTAPPSSEYRNGVWVRTLNMQVARVDMMCERAHARHVSMYICTHAHMYICLYVCTSSKSYLQPSLGPSSLWK